MGAGTAHLFHFGDFTLDQLRYRLLRGERILRLERKPMELLFLLLEKRGELVTREELADRLWGTTVFVDTDQSINTAVRKVRMVLRDDPDKPRFIETVAGKGYRFAAPVTYNGEFSKSTPSAEQTLVEPFVQTPAASAEIQRKPRRWYWALAVCVLALVSYGALAAWRRANTPPPLAVEQQITSNPREAPITGAVMSPDGKYVAYSDSTGVYIRQLNTGEVRPLQLPKGFNAIPTSWFPDGSRLLLKSLGAAPGKPSLWKVSILGGSPQKVLEDADGGVVSPDGSKIAFLRATYPYTQEIWVVESDGSNARRAVQATSDSPISGIAWSPKGTRLAYMRFAGSSYLAGNHYTLETTDLNGGTATVLKTSGQLAPALCWAPDRRLLYANRGDPASERWDSGIWSVRVSEESGTLEGRPQELTRGLGQIGGLSITADGKRLVLWRANGQPGVFLTEMDPATRHFKQPRRLTLDESGNVASAWTPDSTAVLFVSNRNGTWKLFRQAIDQVTPEVLVEGRSIFLPRLSPDGKKILYVMLHNAQDPAQGASVMEVPLQGGSPRVILQMPSMANIQCARSPSKLCLFHTMEGSTLRLFSFNPEDGTKQEFAAIRVTEEPGWNLSPDGSQLILSPSPLEHKVTFMSVDDKSTHEVDLGPWIPGNADWAPDSKSLLVTSQTAEGVPVILSVEPNGNHRVLLEGEKSTGFGWAIPSPDGRHVFVEQLTGANNVWMVENF